MGFACIPSSSVEYVRTAVTGSYTTAMPVHMAVMPLGVEPDAGDWHAAEWDDGHAKIKIGPGTDVGELPEGIHTVWVRVTALDETPVMRAGSIRIT